MKCMYFNMHVSFEFVYLCTIFKQEDLSQYTVTLEHCIRGKKRLLTPTQMTYDKLV